MKASQEIRFNGITKYLLHIAEIKLLRVSEPLGMVVHLFEILHQSVWELVNLALLYVRVLVGNSSRHLLNTGKIQTEQKARITEAI